MNRPTIAVMVALAATLVSGQLTAQNVIADYVCNAPRQFCPDDPWTTGLVFRTQIGYAGCYFNCDCEEQKRYSPYIYWQCQTPCMNSCPLLRNVRQQFCDVKQRIRWGKGCDVPHYHVPWYPLQGCGIEVIDARDIPLGQQPAPDMENVSASISDWGTGGRRPAPMSPAHHTIQPEQPAPSWIDRLLWSEPARLGEQPRDRETWRR